MRKNGDFRFYIKGKNDAISGKKVECSMKNDNIKNNTWAECFLAEKRTTEFAVWVAGLLLGIFAAVVLLTVHFAPFFMENLHYQCWVRSHSGILCPGCGGTRAFFYFLQGEFVLSFFFHPVVPYMGVLYIVYMLRGIVHFLSKGRLPFMRFRLGYVYAAIVILLVQFLLKNILLFQYGIAWI